MNGHDSIVCGHRHILRDLSGAVTTGETNAKRRLQVPSAVALPLLLCKDLMTAGSSGWMSNAAIPFRGKPRMRSLADIQEIANGYRFHVFNAP